jgi:acid stress-induced BolA-like protein IbaG/YrbA
LSTYEIASVLQGDAEITTVKMSGQAERPNIIALLNELQDLARVRGSLRVLIDETDMKPGLMGFNDIHEIVSDWRSGAGLLSSRIAVIAVNPFVRGLNQMFRIAANLEGRASVNAFSKRSDALAWLMQEATAP